MLKNFLQQDDLLNYFFIHIYLFSIQQPRQIRKQRIIIKTPKYIKIYIRQKFKQKIIWQAPQIINKHNTLYFTVATRVQNYAICNLILNRSTTNLMFIACSVNVFIFLSCMFVSIPSILTVTFGWIIFLIMAHVPNRWVGGGPVGSPDLNTLVVNFYGARWKQLTRELIAHIE